MHRCERAGEWRLRGRWEAGSFLQKPTARRCWQIAHHISPSRGLLEGQGEERMGRSKSTALWRLASGTSSPTSVLLSPCCLSFSSLHVGKPQLHPPLSSPPLCASTTRPTWPSALLPTTFFSRVDSLCFNLSKPGSHKDCYSLRAQYNVHLALETSLRNRVADSQTCYYWQLLLRSIRAETKNFFFYIKIGNAGEISFFSSSLL